MVVTNPCLSGGRKFPSRITQGYGCLDWHSPALRDRSALWAAVSPAAWLPPVLDRVVQQAVAQVLQQVWDPTFSESSFGFRPERSAHDAIRRAQAIIKAGYRVSADLDLSKFFDRVNHDRLMSRLAMRIRDKRVLRLIRAFLVSGMMIGGLVSPTTEGTPQGGPLSPLLSNIVLDELDKKLERHDLATQWHLQRCLRHSATQTTSSSTSEACGQGIE